VGGFIVIFVGSIAVLFFLLLLLLNNRSNRSQEKQVEIVEVTLEWGRLAPFPDGIENLSVQTEGNLFTRSFRVSFTSTNEEIKKWVTESPGLADAKIEVMEDGKQRYVITPGGGANYAEVIIDFESSMVQVYVSWS
jgi:hypothetical protein